MDRVLLYVKRCKIIFNDKVKLYSVAFYFIFSSSHAMAESYFNPAFLEGDHVSITDLSRFENGSRQPAGIYRVDIWLNGEFVFTKDIGFSESNDSNLSNVSGGLTPCLTPGLIRQLGVMLPKLSESRDYNDKECVNITEKFQGSESVFDFNKLHLNLSFPQASLASNARGFIPSSEWDEGISAGLLNYTLTGSRGTYGDSNYLNLQSGINSGPWRLRNNSVWSLNTSSDNKTMSSWKNISSYVQRAIIPLKSELILGDNNTSNDVFDSTGYRGVRIYSDDNMYPNSLQGYAPTVRGIARTNAKITIRQNGYVVYQNFVTPGPFDINDLNPTTSSGDLEVSVEENDGVTQVYSVPYSTVPLLQREGRIKFDVTAGDFRSGNSQQEPFFFTQGSLIAGLRKGITLYGGTQLSERYKSLAVGLGKNLGDLGAISADITSAWSQLADESNHSGQSLRFLYAKSLNNIGTNFQLLGYRYSTSGFYTLDDVAYKTMEGYEYEQDEDQSRKLVLRDYHNLRLSKKGKFQANISQSLKEYGSIYLSGSQQTYWGTDQSSASYQFGYANGWHGVNYSISLSGSRSVGVQGTDRIIGFNISVPFSALLGPWGDHKNLKRSYATTSLNSRKDGQVAWQSGVGGTLLDDGNLNYSVNKGNNDSGSLNATLQGGYGTVGSGYNYDKNQHSLNWMVSGGVVAHSEGVTFSQPLGDTNILVAAPGADSVKVENQTGVKTDWRGYTVIPYAVVYRYNRVALDPSSMGSSVDIENNVSRVVPTRGAIVKSSFDTHIGMKALLTVSYRNKPVPFGAIVSDEGSGITGMVGEEGQVYLSGLPQKGKILIQWGKGSDNQCRANYQLPDLGKKQEVIMSMALCH
jgi:outer membrane usher protein